MTAEKNHKQLKTLKQRDSLYSEAKHKKPEGYMIIQHLKQFSDYSTDDWKRHLSYSPLLSDFLRKEITNGNLLINTPVLYDFYWLIPYYTAKQSMLKKGFHNMGQPYYWEIPDWLQNCTSTKYFEHKNGFYYCMVLPGHLQRAGVHIRFSEIISQHSSSFLEVDFFGPLIGTSDCCSHSGGSAQWTDIQISLLCDNTSRHYILPNIGLDISKLNSKINQAKRLVAPLRLRIPLKGNSLNSSCQKKHVNKIELTFNHLYGRIHVGNRPVERKNIIWKKYGSNPKN